MLSYLINDNDRHSFLDNFRVDFKAENFSLHQKLTMEAIIGFVDEGGSVLWFVYGLFVRLVKH